VYAIATGAVKPRTKKKMTKRKSTPPTWALLPEPARSIILAIHADPFVPVHETWTKGQLQHARQLCVRATKRWPWRSLMSIDSNAPRIVERHLDADAIDEWAAACFAALHAARAKGVQP